ncbi:hypothetical protein N7451_009774 [Penicillium sp. IBT 35674x]|nr:hypothetical protein N7451_009774 [Penicillium sp. IBT 35674x]
MQKHVDRVADDHDTARSQERWLDSGWALQEEMSDQAIVLDVTVPTTRLVLELALGYFIKSQGHQPDIGA